MNHMNDFNLEFLNVCNRLGRHIWVGGRGGSGTAGRWRLLHPASCRQLQLLVWLGHQLLLRVCLSTWCLGKSLFIIFFNYDSCNIWHLFSSKSVLRRGNLSCFNLAEKSWGFRKKHSVGLPSPNYWLNLSYLGKIQVLDSPDRWIVFSVPFLHYVMWNSEVYKRVYV